jgi:hypothetical protein
MERVIFVTSGTYAETAFSNVTVYDRLYVAAFALSMATNGLATALIAYKAW